MGGGVHNDGNGTHFPPPCIPERGIFKGHALKRRGEERRGMGGGVHNDGNGRERAVTYPKICNMK